ncbi:MAG TPA: fibronectin type III domain-containing protein [Xanthomonadaceae bacterium]|nr:fibronectin type III domain-containing protein [Xanthomonadaceae bacterium]
MSHRIERALFPRQRTVTATKPRTNPDGGSAITGYTASCTPQDGGSAETASGSGSPIIVGDLTNGTTYSCTVSATNALGSGPASAPVEATPSARVPPPVPSVTSVPTLSQWSLMLLGLLAAGAGSLRLRRR